MRSTYDEEEVERTPAAMKWNGYPYFLIRKKITLTITNNRKAASDTRVTLSLGGKVEKASDNAVVKINDYRAADWIDSGQEFRSSMHSNVDWDLNMAPGETKALTFELSYYSR
jgi:hypothetical protein